jgi:tetratricopeptide (TPR) repeat protein
VTTQVPGPSDTSSEAGPRRALAVEPARHAFMQALYGGRYKGRRYREALVACRRAVALDPGNADDRCNLGEILVRLERRGEGLRHLAEAAAVDRSSARSSTRSA